MPDLQTLPTLCNYGKTKMFHYELQLRELFFVFLQKSFSGLLQRYKGTDGEIAAPACRQHWRAEREQTNDQLRHYQPRHLILSGFPFDRHRTCTTYTKTVETDINQQIYSFLLFRVRSHWLIANAKPTSQNANF